MPTTSDKFADLPGVRRVEFLRVQSVLVDPAQPRIVLLARDLPADDPSRALPLVAEGPAPAAGDPPPVWVSEAMVDLYGYSPGRRITLPLAGRPVAFTVAGVWRDYARQQGSIVMERALYAALTGDTTANDAALFLEPGARSDDVRRELEARAGAGGKLAFAAPAEIRAASLQVFDRTFAVTYALEAAAVGLGLVGLSSSFGALVFARRREFGMLRHVGTDAAADRGHARHRRRAGQRHRAGRRAGAGVAHEPHPDLRGQPPVVSLEHGTACAVAAACWPSRSRCWCWPRRRHWSARGGR